MSVAVMLLCSFAFGLLVALVNEGTLPVSRRVLLQQPRRDPSPRRMGLRLALAKYHYRVARRHERMARRLERRA